MPVKSGYPKMPKKSTDKKSKVKKDKKKKR